ncbi:MAG: hypothetical protein M3Q07_25545 [Pseudobdellovibrionaceae bacterium]|nr:hypothetical protein [Pseudobdellovibrionaceae bacterium]
MLSSGQGSMSVRLSLRTGWKIILDIGATTVPGVFACGDITRFASVLIASASGVVAGSGAAFELLDERLRI